MVRGRERRRPLANTHGGRGGSHFATIPTGWAAWRMPCQRGACRSRVGGAAVGAGLRRRRWAWERETRPGEVTQMGAPSSPGTPRKTVDSLREEDEEEGWWWTWPEPVHRHPCSSTSLRRAAEMAVVRHRGRRAERRGGAQREWVTRERAPFLCRDEGRDENE
jgi:hypothetical protein